MANIDKEEEYQTAVASYNNGNYENAQTVFESLGDYKDSASMADKCDDALFDSLRYVEGSYSLKSPQYSESGALLSELEITSFSSSYIKGTVTTTQALSDRLAIADFEGPLKRVDVNGDGIKERVLDNFKFIDGWENLGVLTLTLYRGDGTLEKAHLETDITESSPNAMWELGSYDDDFYSYHQ